jgi:hypothetical protein
MRGFHHLFCIVLEFLSRHIRQEEERKSIQLERKFICPCLHVSWNCTHGTLRIPTEKILKPISNSVKLKDTKSIYKNEW